jgi:hypothetical protein
MEEHMNNLQQQREKLVQESREAGQRAFDGMLERLHYRNLYWMSQLDDDEHTWENMIACTHTDPEDWDQDGPDYDREAFAQGFFEQFREIWVELEVRFSA